MRPFLVCLLLIGGCCSTAYGQIVTGAGSFGVVSHSDEADGVKPVAPVVTESESDGCYLVVFTTNNCGRCQRWKRDELPKLLKAGHKVRLIDVDEDDRWQVSQVPTFWVVDRRTKVTIWKKTTATMRAADLLLMLTPRRGVTSERQKDCHCSSLCVCGCNDGQPCKCGQKAAPAPVQTSTGMSHSDMIRLHNQLHGGGNWTWPGDLKTHLESEHLVSVE